MNSTAVTASTPHYVLMNAGQRIGPKVVPAASRIECSLIYGFSDKEPYDTFIANSQSALTPFPLVKRYLRNQLDEPDSGLKLVVIDAAGPSQPYLRAASMQAVLEAHENHADQVAATYRLTLDQQADAYTIEIAPV
jgi:hypothetical protein